MGSLNRCEPTQTPDDIDVPALREKYRHERDKRLRKEGSKQFIHTADELADFWETDPHSPPVVRDPISDDVDVVVIGGGFAGLIAGAQLKQAGVEDVRIVEMGGDFGGVWYWNRYPGIQCDNESYSYIPLLEELNYMPSKKFADGAEIQEHCRRIGRHFGLYERAMFGTLVRALRWDESIQRWRISTNHDDDIRARFIVMALGLWSKPKLPGIPGIEDFKGRMFHSARWDYAYTGGSPGDPRLIKLADKRVAIIGTGATAIQIVPYLGRDAEHLYVFQRTPSSVDERGNKPTDPEWVKSLKPGWQKERQANFHAWAWEPFPPAPGSEAGDLICDFWTEINRNMAAKLAAMGGRELSLQELMDAARAGGLPGDGAAAPPHRKHRQGQEDGRDAEALLSLHVQAAVLERRLPADLQSPERHAGRRLGLEGRRADDREGPRRQWRRIRSRLRHLRQRLRDLAPRSTRGLGHRRDRRPRWPVALRSLGQRATRRSMA